LDAVAIPDNARPKCASRQRADFPQPGTAFAFLELTASEMRPLAAGTAFRIVTGRNKAHGAPEIRQTLPIRKEDGS